MEDNACRAKIETGYCYTCEGSKAAKQLQSLIEYCEKNPQERFWQALFNLFGRDKGYDVLAFVKYSNNGILECSEDGSPMKIDDTFYRE